MALCHTATDNKKQKKNENSPKKFSYLPTAGWITNEGKRAAASKETIIFHSLIVHLRQMLFEWREKFVFVYLKNVHMVTAQSVETVISLILGNYNCRYTNP